MTKNIYANSVLMPDDMDWWIP